MREGAKQARTLASASRYGETTNYLKGCPIVRDGPFALGGYMQKWEYLIVSTSGTRVTHLQNTAIPHPLPFFWDVLNKLGDEGWELVSANPEEGLLYLKRQK